MAFAALDDRERAWELLALMNPVNHAATPEGMATYKAEPYVMTADVYALAPHSGRGGWSWYTGSAGWMYRLIVESLLGVTREGDCLRFAPRLPAHWAGFTMRYRYGETTYEIAIVQVPAGPAGTRPATRVTLDTVAQPDAQVRLVDDRALHQVSVEVRG